MLSQMGRLNSLMAEKYSMYLCIIAFLKLYFNDYAITFSQFFSLCPLYQAPHSLRQSPHHCSCPWVMRISSLATLFSVLYFTSPWLFCIYLFVLLNPLTFSLIPLHSTPIWQPSKDSPYKKQTKLIRRTDT